MFARLKDHLMASHSDIKEVQDIDTDKNNFTLIRYKGVDKHNIKVFEDGTGEIIVTRISQNTDVLNYLPCKQCRGWFSKLELWRHKTTCIIQGDNNEISSSLPSKKIVMKLLQNLSSGATEVLCLNARFN